ncbi:hypothetical protein HY988_07630 [Candidatus Micrarchaeota archaeon]|nr:hypothetical protein [Candidatus Micrarchaeota archaeon]
MLQRIPAIVTLSSLGKHTPIKVAIDRCRAQNRPAIDAIVGQTKTIPAPSRRLPFADLPPKMINGPMSSFRILPVPEEEITLFGKEVGKVWDRTAIGERRTYGLSGALLIPGSDISNMFSLRRIGVNLGSLLAEIEQIGEEKRALEILLRLKRGLIGGHSLQTTPEEALGAISEFVRRTRNELASRGVSTLGANAGFPEEEIRGAMARDSGKISTIGKVLTVILAFGFADCW